MSDEPKRKTKSELLKAFKADMTAADTLRLEAVSNRDTWRDAYNGEPYGNEQNGKSAIVSRDIKRQDEWQHASIKDPFVSDQDIIKCSPITFEDKKAAEQNELVLNYQFTRQFNRYKFITDVIKLYYSEGTVIVKTGWDYEDKVEEVEVPNVMQNPITGEQVQLGTRMAKQLKVLVNKPDADICRIEDVYLDPTAEGDIKKAQFIIHRYESDISSLRKSKKYKNLKKLAVKLKASDGGIGQGGDDFDPTDDTEFVFAAVARKKLTVSEYWGNYDIDNTCITKPIVATWVDDILIQLEDNPLPDQEIPFLVLANNSIPFKMYGEANAELIGDNQKITTAIKRGILDNMAGSNNAQKGIKKGALDIRNTKRFLNNKNFEYNGSAADFYDGNYNPIPQSVFHVLEMVNSDTDSMTGVKGFSGQGGITGAAMGSTARAAGGALDAVSVRRLDIVRNIAENLIKPLMRKWTSYNSEFLQPQEVVRITNDEFVDIRRDDLQGNIDIHIHVSTAEDNDAMAKELAFMLQTGQQTMDPGSLKLIQVELFRLKKMPELAKALEEYQPQPDPYTEQMKMLELELKKSEIRERNSRSEENAVDLRLKNSTAALNEAKARELGTKADVNDLDFTRKADGTEHAEKMAEKGHDRDTAVGVESMKQQNKQKS